MKILDHIDATISEQCACGCGAQLRPDGPSAWFAGEGCQQQWRFNQLDPDRARRAEQRRIAAAERRAARHLIRTGQTTTLDREQVTVALRQANAVLDQIADQIREICQGFGRAAAHLAAQFAPILAAQGITQPPTDPQERALAHVRNRNTGPRQQQRAPRHINPRRSR